MLLTQQYLVWVSVVFHDNNNNNAKIHFDRANVTLLPKLNKIDFAKITICIGRMSLNHVVGLLGLVFEKVNQLLF